MNYNNILNIPPFSLSKEKKKKHLGKWMEDLTRFHYENCLEYKKILDSISFNASLEFNYDKTPFLPVRLFKMFDLYSVPKDAVYKTMTSSGTSGQEVSKIYLDKETSKNQTKVLTKIISNFIGTKRSPMLIIDSESVLKNRNMFSARGAGILGFSIFGVDKFFALDKDMKLKKDELIGFLNKYKDRRIFIFGFTFMIYKYFIKELQADKISLNLKKSVLIHGGGWKKLINQSINSFEFKKKLNILCGINKIHDYYGMVEQTGSIYMECEYNYLHASNFSDIIIRNPIDFSIAKKGEIGIIQTLSILPYSYPGHSLLTEDEGVLIGEDDCKCGKLGKYFKVLGRIQNAEIRGCSDTYG